MREEGIRLTCSRCGIKQFHPWTMLPGGRYPESKPKDWVTVNKEDSIHLCPSCAEKYTQVLNNFLQGGDSK